MKSIHVRDVDPVVLKRLQILARLHHRSVQGEIRAILAEAARRAPEDRDLNQMDLVTVETDATGTFRREDIYDDAR
jgi:plasmid stability protein